MNSSSKAFAIVASVIIVAVCLIYALAVALPGIKIGSNIDVTKSETMNAGDDITIDSAISGVTVTSDSNAAGVTAHLYGSSVGINIGSAPELEIVRSGSNVTVRAGRNWLGHIGWSSNIRLDIVIPAGFSGNFDCQSAAGAVNVNSDFTLKSFRAYSSAGSVKVGNIKASGSVEASSSAGSVETGAIEAASADIHSSAGRVYVLSCSAGWIKLHSSAGSVSADNLSGKIEASSSAGSVDITLGGIMDTANISSSASGVRVTLPVNSNANINASTSAGRVTISNLPLTVETQKKDEVKGRLGDGGPELTIHSSAGSVDVNGK